MKSEKDDGVGMTFWTGWPVKESLKVTFEQFLNEVKAKTMRTCRGKCPGIETSALKDP